MARPDTSGDGSAHRLAWDHILAGDRFLAQGREADAEREYRAAIESDPTSPDAHRRLSVALYKRGELEGAQEAARAAAEQCPQSVEAWFTLGLILRDARDPVGALKAFDRVTALQRDHVEALHYHGRVLYEMGAPQKAVASFERAAELDPRSADIAHDLAIAHVACENWAGAEKWFARCVELEPANAETYHELAQAHERDVTTPDDEAEQAYRRAVALEPQHLPARFRLAVLWTRRRRTDPEARGNALTTLKGIAEQEDLPALFPDAYLVYYLLGAILDDEPDTGGEAGDAYRTCLQLRPDFAPAHNTLGVLARRRGDLDEAAAHFRRAIISDPTYDSAIHNLCRVLYDQPNELTTHQIRDIVDLIPDHAPDVLTAMMGHLIDAAKSDAYASSYDKVHEIKNLIGILGARMRRVLMSEECAEVPAAPELMEMQGRAFEAIRGYLSAIQTTPGNQETLDCADLLRKTLRQVAVTRPPGVRLEHHISRGIAPLTGDRRRLTQLFRNLAVNAFEAMPDGGTLRVTAEPLRHGNAPPGATVHRGARIVFEDTGPGMSDGELRRAFDPGFTTKETGSGYGLVVASQVIREHGGTITLDRGEEGGTRATIELPERPQPEAAAERLRLRPVVVEDWRRLIQAEADAIRPSDGSSTRPPA